MSIWCLPGRGGVGCKECFFGCGVQPGPYSFELVLATDGWPFGIWMLVIKSLQLQLITGGVRVV